MDLLSQVLYLVSNAFHIYVYFYCFRTMFGKPKSLLLERISFVAFFLINSILYLTVNIPYLNLLSSVIPILLISLIYNKRIHFELLISLMIYVSSMLLDSIFYNVPAALLPNTDDKIPYLNAVSSIFLFFLALVAKHLKGKKYSIVYSLPIWCATFFIPLSSILVVTVSFYNEYNYGSIALVVSVLLVINIIVFWLFDKLSEYYQGAFEKQMLSEQIHAYTQQMLFIKEQHETVRGIRHDMRNHVTYLAEFLNSKNTSSAQEYLETMGAYLSPQKEYVHSGNPSLDSFLNYKLESLDKIGVVLENNITIPAQLPFPDFDLCVIFGNLLDNVHDAFMRMPTSAQKQLLFKIRFDRGVLYIRVANSFAGELSKTRNAGKTTYKTQKENPSEHGRGLINVERIVKKFGGTIDIIDSDNMYAVEIMLFQI